MRCRFLLVLTLCAGLVLLPGTAGAGTTFTFHGSGWGHGIGMSQYGALGLAQRGWGPGRIVRHYFRGSRVEQRDPPLARFRIGLLQHRRVVKLTAAEGSFVLRLTNGTVIETVPEGRSRRVVIRNGQYRIRKPGGALVGGHAWGNDRVHLKVVRRKGAIVRVAEWGHSLGRGYLRFHIVGSESAHLVAVLGPEVYLFGLGEVPSSWLAAVLAAQAIAARTYAYRVVRNLQANPTAFQARWAACRCDLYGSVADQNYVGWDKEAGSFGSRWVAAVRDTRKRVATYGGAPITAYYSSSSGGHTENIENVWVGSAAQPYLKGVCDPAEDETSNPNEFWDPITMSGTQIADALRNSGLGVGSNVRKFTDFVRGVSGRVKSVKVVGSARSRVVEGWDLRRILRLRDTRFSVDVNHNIRGRIRDRYDGLNCAPKRAESPGRLIDGGRFQRFQVGRLYLHAGKDVVTWVRGAILTKYVAKRAHNGFLGLPYNWKTIDSGNGQRAWFDGGQILWRTSLTEAFEIHGPVLAKYLEVGGFAVLRYPTSDVMRSTDGNTLTSTFVKGTIVCTRPDPDTPWTCEATIT